jgi:hypothetical protein
MTLCLEQPIESSLDMMCYTVVNYVHVDPQPQNVQKLAIIFATSDNQAV